MPPETSAAVAVPEKINGMDSANVAVFSKYLQQRKGAISSVAASFMNTDRVMKVVLRCVAMNPSLQKCTMESIFRSVLMAAELGLELGSPLGEAYPVPFNMKIKGADGIDRWFNIC